MSGITLIFQRDQTPVDPELIDRMMARLIHLGPDGREIILAGSAGLGHCHFWTTPEEEGERQPLWNLTGDKLLAFDGRLDNRAELIAQLELDGEARRLSDAALVLMAYESWREDCFEHLLGPFAVVIYDRLKDQVVLARDPLGDRTLFYYQNERVLAVASEPYALLAHPSVSTRLDETNLALYFAGRAPDDGRSFFADICEMLPAHLMIVNRYSNRQINYWQPEVRSLRYRTNDEYSEHFAALLEVSVASRLRSITPPAVMMSGGLDSTSVAAVAARLMKANGSSDQLISISYVFDELHSCDERSYINELNAFHAIRPIHVSVDDAWPLRDWSNWPWNPNMPEGNPYRLLKERVYRTALESGHQILLTGVFGDQLYQGSVEWLADLLAEFRLREAGREILRHLRGHGRRNLIYSGDVRRVGGRMLDRLPGGRRLWPYRDGPEPQWLVPSARKMLPPKRRWQTQSTKSFRIDQWHSLLGSMAARNAAGEIFHASRYSIDLRHPYRDRRLVEFVLSIPAHQLYNAGVFKFVLRNAMKGQLPEVIRTRRHPTTLLPFLRRAFSTVNGLLLRLL